MKDVLLQIKNLNTVAEHYKSSSDNKIKTASATAIGTTFLFLLIFLLIFCFKLKKHFLPWSFYLCYQYLL